jgi:hypothetical protein
VLPSTPRSVNPATARNAALWRSWLAFMAGVHGWRA